MRIAYVLTRGDTTSGGAYIHVRDMARHMVALGHRVRVIVGRGGSAAMLLRGFGLDVAEIPSMDRDIRPDLDLFALFALRRTLRAFQPDLVSAHTAKAGVLVRLALAGTGVPVVYTAHGVPYVEAVSRAKRLAYASLEMLVRPFHAHVVAVCEADRALAVAYRTVAPDHIEVIQNGVHDVSPSLRARPELTPVRICAVARFEPQKDHATLLAALATLTDLPWSLHLFGGGPGEADVRRRVRELGLVDRVHFEGAVADMAPALAKSQLYVLATKWEGLPRSILEAMRAALPVVATNVGGVAEAVVDGRTGLLAPRGDAAELARQLRALITDPALRRSFGDAGRRRYEENFTFTHMASATVALYDRLVPRMVREAAPVVPTSAASSVGDSR